MVLASRAAVQAERMQLAASYNDLLHKFDASHLEVVGNYALSTMVGKGSFGEVFLATHVMTGSKVVLKSTRKDDPNLAREIHHHRQMKHPHIAELYEVIIVENFVYLALEYCPGQELYDYLLRHRPLPLDHAKKIFSQICGAVAHVHSKSCVHRDLKLENILLDKYDQVKLCDFGFTRESHGLMSTFCGTTAYVAPEMIRGEKYLGEAADVWSLGVILYTLIAGELPFDDDDEAIMKTKITDSEPNYSDRFPAEAVELLKAMLSKQKTKRPSVREILQDPFLAEYGPRQQSILLSILPVPFSTRLEQRLLESMSHAGLHTASIVKSVLAQECDALAGFWTLAYQREGRRESRRLRRQQRRMQSSLTSEDSSARGHTKQRDHSSIVDNHSHLHLRAHTRARDPGSDLGNTAMIHPSHHHHSAQPLFQHSFNQVRVNLSEDLTAVASVPQSPGAKIPRTPDPRSSIVTVSVTESDLQLAPRPSKRQVILATLKHWFIEPTRKSTGRGNKTAKISTPRQVSVETGDRRPPPVLNSISHYNRRSYSGGGGGATPPYGSTSRSRYSSRPGLGYASTSSSFSSMRSLHRQSQSKASSASSTSLPSLRSPRSSRHNIKVMAPAHHDSLHATSTVYGKSKASTQYNEGVPLFTFARRRKTPFRGPMRAKKESASSSRKSKEIIREEDIVEEVSEDGDERCRQSP